MLIAWIETIGRRGALSAALLSLSLVGASGCADTEPTSSEGETARSELVAEMAIPKLDSAGAVDFAELARSAASPEAEQAVEACRNASPQGCYELGDRLHGGDEIRRDNALSVQLIDYACRIGWARACYDMGARLHVGVEVDQDLQAARSYFQHACAQGIPSSCHMLGRIAREGIGVPVDTDMAERFMRRSCELGFSRDCQALDWPVEPDLERREWQLPADAPDRVVESARICDSGLMSGCVALAEAYETGDGVPQDTQRAFALYESACDWGALDACKTFRKMQ